MQTSNPDALKYTVIACVLMLTVTFAGLALYDVERNRQPKTQSTQVDPPKAKPASTATGDYDNGFTERFRRVSEIFVKQGASVDPWDPNARWTMRVYFPSNMAMDMSDSQAKEVAAMAQSRLGDNAIVYVKSESGRTLAKAAPWGVSGSE